jgi:hypothetical protein
MQRRWSIAFFVVFAASADAQRIQLELRPKVGDTLRMRLDQVTELSGARLGAAMKDVVTTFRMFSRAIVERSVPPAVLILAITDSVRVSTSDEHGGDPAAASRSPDAVAPFTRWHCRRR